MGQRHIDESQETSDFVEPRGTGGFAHDALTFGRLESKDICHSLAFLLHIL
jgi:hypothetical protein